MRPVTESLGFRFSPSGLLAMADVEDIQGKRYPGYGRCIYCGSPGLKDGLREEHIIPRSLGGKAVIDSASCTDCEKITSYIDGYLGRHIFQEYRAHAGTPTRRPRERPTEFPARIIVDGIEEVRHFATARHPYFLAMPVWGLPTIMTGAQPTAAVKQMKAHVYEFVPDNIRETLGLPDGVNLQIRGTGSINYTTFARAIAKIAYCHTIIRYGLTGFRRLVLPQIILGRYPFVPQFVGGPLEDPPPPAPQGQLHIVNFERFSLNRLSLICVSVRLFAHSGFEGSGMPVYRVLSGAYKHRG